MRILHINNWLPAPPLDGGKLRKLQQLSALRTQHEVSVLGRAFADDDAEWLARELPGTSVIVAESGPDGASATPAAIAHALQRDRYDVLHVSGVAQWPRARDASAHPVVLDVDSIESRVLETLSTAGASSITPLDIEAVRILERHAFARASLVLACSSRDAETIGAIAPSARVAVVPNAIDVSRYALSPLPPSVAGIPTITFTGFLAYRPNVDACVHFVRDILPLVRTRLGEVRVQLVGRLPPPEVVALGQVPGVHVHADVPDIAPFLASADVVVVPLRAGSGTRLKILEAFATGRPVVSTSLGCEGLDVADREHLRIADDPPAFADAIADVVEDRAFAASLTARARALVEAQYDCTVVAETLRHVYEDLAAEVRRSRR